MSTEPETTKSLAKSRLTDSQQFAMSISRLSPFNTTSVPVPQFGPSEELVATVPDLHFGVLPLLNGATELNYIEPFTNPRKRNRSDSGCSLSDFDISGDELDYSSLKRPCTLSPPYYTSHQSSPAQDFTLELDGVFHFGVNPPSKETPITSSGIAPPTSSPQLVNTYPPHQINRLQVFGTGMQPAELTSTHYKSDLMLNCDQDCKLIITEHPEEVLTTHGFSNNNNTGLRYSMLS